ncbi:hypothetical protein PGB90_004180 [Kerria lacca]
MGRLKDSSINTPGFTLLTIDGKNCAIHSNCSKILKNTAQSSDPDGGESESSNLDDLDYIPDLSKDYDVNHALPPTIEPTDDSSSSRNDSSSLIVAMPSQQLQTDRVHEPQTWKIILNSSGTEISYESTEIPSSSCCTPRSSHDNEFIRPSSSSSSNSSNLLVNKNGKVMKNERFQQQSIKDFVDKIVQKDIENITNKIGEFLFDCNIPFNAIESKLKKKKI